MSWIDGIATTTTATTTSSITSSNIDWNISTDSSSVFYIIEDDYGDCGGYVP